MKLQYRSNNAYTYMLVYNNHRAEIYYMDGTEDFPILNSEEAATDYLSTVSDNIDNLSGADSVFEREEGEMLDDFLSRICVDDDHASEIIAEYENPEQKEYFILRNLDGYGSEYPVCVDEAEADRLYREWDCTEPFEEVWNTATEYEIATYGRYDTEED